MPRLLPIILVLLLAGPAVAQLPAAELAKIKAATVFVKVRFGSGDKTLASSGSGFLVRAGGKVGYVVTNDHVVSLLIGSGDGKAVPSAVELVFDSGTPTEWTAPGTVTALDPDRDLAVLKVTAPKTLPAPIPLTGPDAVPETTPVFVCGFPLGSALAAGTDNPGIAINQTTVSATRRNANGAVERVDLNGGVSPGNSGGPVVTSDGKLVGVAAAVAQSGRGGAVIGLCVPHQQVSDTLRGRVVTRPVFQSRRWLDDRKGEFQAAVVDPLDRVKAAGVTGHVAPAAEGMPPADLSKLKTAVAYPLTDDPDSGPRALRAEVAFPPGAEFLWVQTSWTDADGKTVRGPVGRQKVLTAADFDKLSAPPKEPAEKETPAEPEETPAEKPKAKLPPKPVPTPTPKATAALPKAEGSGGGSLLSVLAGAGILCVVGGGLVVFLLARKAKAPAARTRPAPPADDDNPFA